MAGPGLQGTPVLLILVVAVVYLPRIARMSRAAALEVVTRDHVLAARLRGRRHHRHPLARGAAQCLGRASVEFAVRAGYAPVLVGTLGFLGFGLRPPSPEWGLMMAEYRNLLTTQPMAVFGPGLMLASLVVGLSFLTEGLSARLARPRHGGRHDPAVGPRAEHRLRHSLGRRAGGSGRFLVDCQGRGLLGLVGNSGSGKSTVGAAVMGEIARNGRASGRVLFKGEDVLTLPAPALRQLRGGKIALIPQNPTTALNPALRIGRQLAETIRHPRHRAPAGSASLGLRGSAGLGRVTNAQGSAARYPHQMSAGNSSA